MALEARIIEKGFSLENLSKNLPKQFRAYMKEVLDTAYLETKQKQPDFKPTLLVDGSTKKLPENVKLNKGTLTLVDAFDIEQVIKDAEELFYQTAPVDSGEYKRSARWIVGSAISTLPLGKDAINSNENLALTEFSVYSRRMEFGKKDLGVTDISVKQSKSGKLKLIKKKKRRWSEQAPYGVLLVVAAVLREKYADLEKAGKLKIRFIKIKAKSPLGGKELDSYPAIIFIKNPRR